MLCGRFCPCAVQVAEASVGQTARVLLKEAVQEGCPAAEDSDNDAANPLWGQREDKQIQVGAVRCGRRAWWSDVRQEGGRARMGRKCCSGARPLSQR